MAKQTPGRLITADITVKLTPELEVEHVNGGTFVARNLYIHMRNDTRWEVEGFELSAARKPRTPGARSPYGRYQGDEFTMTGELNARIEKAAEMVRRDAKTRA